MSIYSISDLHLSFNTPEKSMSKFGWDSYTEKIKQSWLEKIKKDDIILIPGDTSWALKLENADKDLSFLGELPGKKILLKGNHDFWWNSISKINKFLKEKNFNIELIQYNSIEFEDYIISGVRGWEYKNELDEDNQKKYNRELARFDMCISSIKKLLSNNKNKKVVFMMHYPPFTAEFPETPFLDKIIENKDLIDIIVFGHLHAIKNAKFYNREIEGVKFYLVSADIVNFELVKLI
jgi:hypothetical protein